MLNSIRAYFNFFTMKRKSAFILFLFYSVNVFNILSQNYSKFLHHLEKLYGKELPASFFVIQAYTGLEVFTNAPAIIDRMNEIKQYPCPYVFMIWKDEGGLGNNFYYYLKKNYYIDTNQFIKAYIANDLFKYLGEVPNSEVYYFHHRQLIKKWDGKYDKIQESLPYDVIQFESPVVKKWENTPPYYHTNTSIFRPINDTLAIELFDGQDDRIRLVNLFNGKVMKVAHLYNLIDYVDVYMNVFKNPYNFSKEVILNNDTFHRRIQRTPLRVENVYVKDLNEIYLLSDASIYGPSPKEFYVPGEYKDSTFVVKQGSITNFSYGIILKTDTSLQIKDIFYIPSFDIDTFYANNFIVHESAFLKKDSLYYIPGYLFNHFTDKTYNDFYKKNEHTAFIYTFRRNNNILEFVRKEKAICQYPFKLFYRYETFHLFANKQNIFAAIDPFPEIYTNISKKPVQYILSPSIVKKYKFVDEYKEPNQEPHIPFTIAGIAPILKGKFLLVIYKLNKNLYFKLFDKNLNAVQESLINTKLSNIVLEKIYYCLSFITDNYIQIPYCDSKGCYNLLIPIKIKNVLNPIYNIDNTYIR